MEISKLTLKEFRRDFKETVANLEAQYDVKIDLGSITFQKSQFTSRLTVKSNTVDGVDSEAYDFERHMRFYDFKKSDYKRKLRLDGDVFEFIGFNPKSPKNSCSIRSTTSGRSYSCTANTVKGCFI